MKPGNHALTVAIVLGFAVSLQGQESAALPPNELRLPVSGSVAEPVQPMTDPVAVELELNRGILEFEQGRYADALDHLQRAGSSTAAAYYRGLALSAVGKYVEASKQFQIVRQSPGAPKELLLDLGVAQLGAKANKTAITTLSQYVAANPNDALGSYMYGVALCRDGRKSEAIAHFEVAAKDETLAERAKKFKELAAKPSELPANKPSELPVQNVAAAERISEQSTQPARGYGRPIDPQADPNRKWNLTLVTAIEYDSNVPLSPDINGLGGGAKLSDGRAVIALFGDYRLIQNENFNFGVFGSTYDNFHFELDDFNLQDYMGGVYTNAAFGNFVAGVNYQFHESLLDARQLATNSRLVPNLTYREGTLGHSTVYYEFDTSAIDGLALIPAQQRSADVNAVGFTQAFYFWESGRFFLGYRYEDANAAGSDFDRTTNMVTARIEMPLTQQMIADAEVRYFWDDYSNPNSLDFFDRPRRDGRWEVRAGVQKYFNAHLSARLDYTYINSDSNVANLFGVEFYSYDRHVVSAQLIYDF